MNTIKKYRLIASAVVLCLFNTGIYAEKPGVEYIQLSSSINQPAGSEANLASFEQVNGTLLNAQHKVTVKADGVYFLMVAGQVGDTKNKAQAEGYVDLWLLKNGKPIPKSNSRQTLMKGQSSVLAAQSIIKLKAGDSISIGYSASNPSMGFVSMPATTTEPAITSIVFTMYKI